MRGCASSCSLFVEVDRGKSCLEAQRDRFAILHEPRNPRSRAVLGEFRGRRVGMPCGILTRLLDYVNGELLLRRNDPRLRIDSISHQIEAATTARRISDGQFPAVEEDSDGSIHAVFQLDDGTGRDFAGNG